MCGPSPPVTPATLAVEMMLPPVPCDFITGAACFIPKNGPRSRTFIVSVVLVRRRCPRSGPTVPTTPALLKMQSSRPNFDAASATAAFTSSSTRDVRAPVRRQPAQLGRERLPAIVLHVGDDAARALLDEQPHRGLADAARAARDHRHLAVESSHLVLLGAAFRVSAAYPPPVGYDPA